MVGAVEAVAAAAGAVQIGYSTREFEKCAKKVSALPCLPLQRTNLDLTPADLSLTLGTCRLRQVKKVNTTLRLILMT